MFGSEQHFALHLRAAKNAACRKAVETTEASLDPKSQRKAERRRTAAEIEELLARSKAITCKKQKNDTEYTEHTVFDPTAAATA